jgi:hypothetical protein
MRFEKAGFTTHETPLVRKDSVWVTADVTWAVVGGLDAMGETRSEPWVILEALAVVVGADLLMGGAFTLPSTVHATLEPSP